MKISFCQTCGNRSHQLRLTLPINLNIISKFPNTELVIVNYSSTDGFQETVNEVVSDFKLNKERLKIVNVPNKQYFRHAHAKNIAHKAASGDVLCNLDVDNFLTIDFVKYLFDLFYKNINSITDGNNLYNGGTFGRITISKENFYKLRGYPESFDDTGYGEEDGDFLNRAIKFLNCEFVRIPPEYLFVLHHSDKERVENLQNKDRCESITVNQKMSRMLIKQNMSKRNGEVWGEY
jgi:glycosyltransferase involved in cell wall biosynthesis